MEDAPREAITPMLKEEIARAQKQGRTDVPATLAEARALFDEVRQRGAARVVDTLKERARTLVEMAEQAAFYLTPPAAYDAAATAKFWKEHAAERYALLIKRLETQEGMDAAALEGLYRFLAADLGLKLVDLAQLTRIAVTGKAASPPIFEVVSILGKAETLARLRTAAAALEAGR